MQVSKLNQDRVMENMTLRDCLKTRLESRDSISITVQYTVLTGVTVKIA